MRTFFLTSYPTRKYSRVDIIIVPHGTRRNIICPRSTETQPTVSTILLARQLARRILTKLPNRRGCPLRIPHPNPQCRHAEAQRSAVDLSARKPSILISVHRRAHPRHPCQSSVSRNCGPRGASRIHWCVPEHHAGTTWVVMDAVHTSRHGGGGVAPVYLGTPPFLFEPVRKAKYLIL